MPREPQDVTEAELAILQALWKQPRASIRQLTDALHPRGDASEYATVKKQLERMEAKGLVERDRSLFVHLFSAAVDRQELVGRRLRQLADKLCEGSFAPIVSFLGKAKPLSAEERRALRELIESPQSPAQKEKRPRKE
jgi:predicted transcriptional regulator